VTKKSFQISRQRRLGSTAGIGDRGHRAHQFLWRAIYEVSTVLHGADDDGFYWKDSGWAKVAHAFPRLFNGYERRLADRTLATIPLLPTSASRASH